MPPDCPCCCHTVRHTAILPQRAENRHSAPPMGISQERTGNATRELRNICGLCGSCNVHLKPHSLPNTDRLWKAQALPGELAQSLCSALAAVWHVHSMGRPSAASVAYSLVTGWIRSVSALACPSERCTAPSRTRTMPSVGLVSDCPEA